MSTIDYLLSGGGLVAILILMRERELTARRLRVSLMIATIIAVNFLHGVPTSGPDGVLVALGIAAGALCAAIGAATTRLEIDGDGRVVARATWATYLVTVLAFGGRMAFAFAATHGLGPSIGRFSASVGITSQTAWVAALVLMAVVDIALRALLLWARRSQLRAAVCLAG